MSTITTDKFKITWDKSLGKSGEFILWKEGRETPLARVPRDNGYRIKAVMDEALKSSPAAGFPVGGCEVGYAWEGHPTPEEKRDRLNEFLDVFGRGDVWWSEPEIREQHLGVYRDNFGRGDLAVRDHCAWAVYGVLNEQPSEETKEAGKKWLLAEGVRITTERKKK